MAGKTRLKKMQQGPECPCGSGQDYSECCGHYIDNGELPATAEQLMRSRYSAYVLVQADYLLHTWHTSTRPAQIDLSDADALKWLGLRILRCEANDAEDRNAMVEFVARYQVNGRAGRLHEVSRFRREGGQWFYVGGQIISA